MGDSPITFMMTEVTDGPQDGAGPAGMPQRTTCEPRIFWGAESLTAVSRLLGAISSTSDPASAARVGAVASWWPADRRRRAGICTALPRPRAGRGQANSTGRRAPSYGCTSAPARKPAAPEWFLGGGALASARMGRGRRSDAGERRPSY